MNEMINNIADMWERGNDMIEIARTTTFATANRRDIVRRLMCTCESFKRLAFADALAQFRYYEREGLVQYGDGFVVIHHACD